MIINLHIERLILDNISINSYQQNKLKVAIESELKQQLANQGIGSTMLSQNIQQIVKGGSILLKSFNKPASVGQNIGKAVYQGIKR